MRFSVALLFTLAITSAFAAPKGNSNIANDVMNAALGFFSGSGILEQIPDSVNCLLDTAGLKAAIQQAWSDCSDLSPDDIASCIELIGNTVGDEIQYCGDTAEEAWALAQTIWGDLKTQQWDEEALYRLINNYQVVLADLKDALASYKTGAWLGAGLDVGQVVGLFLNFVPSQPQTFTIPKLQDATITDSVDIISGIVNGLGLTNEITSLPVCEQSVQNFTALIEAVEPLLKNDTDAALFQALALIGNSFQELLTMRTSCDATVEQLKGYVVAAAAELANHRADATAILQLIENYQNTAVDIQTIITYYNEGQWSNFGNAIGEFLSYVLDTIHKDENNTFLKIE